MTLTARIMDATSLDEFTTKDLLAFYNNHRTPIKAFRNRAQAEERVLDLIGELEGGGSDEAAEPENDWPAEFTVATSEAEAEAEAEEDSPSQLSSLVGQLTQETPAEETPPAADTVTLAALCAEVQVVARIARRRLRKALGKLDEESTRWEFPVSRRDEILTIIRG